ncbi:hypothetical protein OROGR_013468 [Orobanche gracilis]
MNLIAEDLSKGSYNSSSSHILEKVGKSDGRGKKNKEETKPTKLPVKRKLAHDVIKPAKWREGYEAFTVPSRGNMTAKKIFNITKQLFIRGEEDPIV